MTPGREALASSACKFLGLPILCSRLGVVGLGRSFGDNILRLLLEDTIKI